MREADIVSGNITSTEKNGEDVDEVLEESHLLLDDSCSGILYPGMETWNTESHCGMNDSESEEVLNAINPNEVYPSAAAAGMQEVLSESDSGLSEDQCSDGAHEQKLSVQQMPALYQVVYDISSLGAVITERGPPHMEVISIQLDDWSSQMLLSDSCVVNELVSPVKMESDDTQQSHTPDSSLVYPELQLTEEEQSLLNQEGIALPNNLPLTKAEERILKKVRRKIRNKLSAQDSRRRKKDYIDGLESRVTACSAQNTDLQRTVEQLEKHNISLVAQLRKLQSLIKQTATKAAQTSTCLMIIIFSLGLIIFPSYSPFTWRSAEDSYAPSAVMSRNILNDAASLSLSEDVGLDEPMISDPLTDHSRPDEADVVLDVPQVSEDVAVRQGSVLDNDTAVTKGTTNTPAAGFIAPVASGNAATDAGKPPHADEM
ncbi:Cyclic AMP-responsive element-binding protein 3-like protein 4 [Triplophysa tibetana]|uniref:Cyclic AMP-responsive element-binding protein 3-like protein 4 n=1 Tax=Triplophysa tibetana TaxID=1572043 RepID=A0A5A9N095_9TELE|nr:Cyclic AMP-responsive element-binding protein 3-like protein 4 [Triplophysa tibetana]